LFLSAFASLRLDLNLICSEPTFIPFNTSLTNRRRYNPPSSASALN